MLAATFDLLQTSPAGPRNRKRSRTHNRCKKRSACGGYLGPRRFAQHFVFGCSVPVRAAPKYPEARDLRRRALISARLGEVIREPACLPRVRRPTLAAFRSRNPSQPTLLLPFPPPPPPPPTAPYLSLSPDSSHPPVVRVVDTSHAAQGCMLAQNRPPCRSRTRGYSSSTAAVRRRRIKWFNAEPLRLYRISNCAQSGCRPDTKEDKISTRRRSQTLSNSLHCSRELSSPTIKLHTHIPCASQAEVWEVSTESACLHVNSYCGLGPRKARLYLLSPSGRLPCQPGPPSLQSRAKGIKRWPFHQLGLELSKRKPEHSKSVKTPPTL